MIPMAEIQINGERISLIGPTAVFASKSEPGIYRTVYNGSCDCPGYLWRNTCRHLKTVQTLNEQMKQAAA